MSRSLAVLLCLAAGLPLRAEPWADPALPPVPGLHLWLDAARQPDAHRAAGLPAPVANARVAIAFDASGNKRHLRQPTLDAQPRLLLRADHAAFRFDGEKAALHRTGPAASADAFTLFVVASARANPGFFRAFVSANALGRNDYLTGFNLDLGGFGSSPVQAVNVEGPGFVGAVNLLDRPLPFQAFHLYEVTCAPGGVRLFVDGRPTGKRDRGKGSIRLDEITVGARLYSNNNEPAHLSGHLPGEVAEVLLYDRALTDAERERIRPYLSKRHAHITRALLAPTGPPPRIVANPPAIQVLVPGFVARQLPLDLPNINNLRYRPDGKLVALAYNGDVYLLSDKDGDGLEDTATLFWESKGRLRSPIGMALTPPGYAKGMGLFVPSKGKLSLIVDSTGKGERADREVVVASGWKELPHGVDALGVAVAEDGAVYFGLGTTDFTNAYLTGKKGKARYDPKGDAGAVLRVAPDFSKREVFASGIRFPVGMAFNARGDLFATDQEGATWLANGNPFDELLHVQRGRHYGFPPRHPTHLPHVIDEPSTYDYGPQHQSTCGLAFNEGVATFGPRAWKGDALVTGYSRGKLYRTALAHTPQGYVARNHLLACLDMLAVDACVAPNGDLVVAVHSGLPDWGTGPGGKGKLYRISYTGKALPQPVAVWPAGPREVRVAFDRSLAPEQVRDLAQRTVLEHGPYVRAGDRFEKHRPGYAIVQMEQAAPRERLAIHSVAMSPDSRTLVLATAPQVLARPHALTLPGLGREAKAGKGEVSQVPETDLDYDLSGVEAVWRVKGGAETAPLWLPHPDPRVWRPFTAGSAEHESLVRTLRGAGKLVLRGQLDLGNMLRPATQPGSKLDHSFPPERVTLIVRAKAPFVLTVGGEKAKDGRATLTPREGELVAWSLEIDKPEGEVDVGVSFVTAEDDRERPLALHRFLLPWARRKVEGPALVRRKELEGGSWVRGQAVFHSDEAACAKCHRVGGRGSKIGPDLSNLVHRDYASVVRDIVQPSAALNPDHLAYLIEMRDGRMLFGVVRSEGGRLIVGDVGGRELSVDPKRVASMTAVTQSLMPEGIDKVLGPAKMRDLLTFLLTTPLSPAPIERAGAPEPRSRAELDAVLKAPPAPAKAGKKLRIVLAAGPKDHGPGEHDYPLWQRRWFNLLSLAEDVQVDMVMGWPTAVHWRTADVIVFYSHHAGWGAERAPDLDAFLVRGGGLVYLHYAVEGHRAADALAERIGLAWRGGLSRFRHGEVTLSFDKAHPIARNFDRVRFVDESYWSLVGDEKRVSVLATGVEDGKARPLMWTREHGKGRVFVNILGHYNWTFDDPLFRVLVLRGMAWTVREPVDRLTGLAAIGARMRE